MTAAIISAIAILFAGIAAAQNTGYATYSNNDGGVCSGVASGLPVVSMNAAQFGSGAACGRCVQIQGTGNGAGQNPVSTAPYVAIVNNICPSCAPGDIDLQESGDGKFGITWSFVACPGAGRRLIEGGRKMIVAEDVAAAPEASQSLDAAIPAVQTGEEPHAADEQPESASSPVVATAVQEPAKEQQSDDDSVSSTVEPQLDEESVRAQGLEALAEQSASPRSADALPASRKMLF